MSTHTVCANNTKTELHPWITFINEHDYHAAARAGRFLSSTMLKEFRRSPARYRHIVLGLAAPRNSVALRLGRAVHKLVLEGEAAFRASFTVGGPVNNSTGRGYGSETQAFGRWLAEEGMTRERVLNQAEADLAKRARDAVLSHPEAGKLLARGVAEGSARAEYAGVACQMRLDWLTDDAVAVDLKTVDNLDRFETDARRFGYLHQFAFYRGCGEAAGSGELAMAAVAVEKRSPYRVGVWYFTDALLAPYRAENEAALARLIRCRENESWPTGYEEARLFPASGIPVPPSWLN